MKHYRFLIISVVVAALSAALSLGQAPTSNDERAKAKLAAKAKRNAKNFERNASVITFFDRQGKIVGTAGERAMYEDTVLSPDRSRVAVVKDDLDGQSADLYVLEVATGKSIRLTTSKRDEFVQTPVWSPDGAQLVYVEIRDGTEGAYRRAADGTGLEALLYKNPSAFMDLADWSKDGKFLSFASSDLSGGTLYILPLSGDGERKPTEIFHSESRLFAPHFSPDGRFVSYVSVDQHDQRNEVFVRSVDSSAGAGSWQVSEGSRLGAWWRRDGKELYYIGLDLSVMVVEANGSAATPFAKPKALFRPPGAAPLFIRNISSDGERFLILPPPRGPQLQQITIYDRRGNVVSKVGDPGMYSQPTFSPDGKRLALLRTDPASGQADFWTLDVTTGKRTPVTNDRLPKSLPILWSHDGRYIFYVSFRDKYDAVYRRPSDGSGKEELLFRYTPGAFFNLTDISPDGKYLALSSGAVILTVPLTGADPVERKAIEFSREEFNVGNGRFSPDGRFLAYVSNEIEDLIEPNRSEVWVREFNASTGMAGKGKWQLSRDGAAGMEFWRADGKEFFYRHFPEPGTDDMVVMAAEVGTKPDFQAGTPNALFTLPGPLGGTFGDISPDGQRFAFAINVPAK